MTPVAAIAQSGLAAATLKLSASASNTANARDTSAVGASGYQPLGVVDSALPDGGVTVQAVNLKPASLLAYDPTSPLSNPQGYVQAPEIDPISEISSQMAASQAFAYSLKVLRAAKQEQQTLVDLKT